MRSFRLSREQADLLMTLAEAYEEPGQHGQKEPILFSTSNVGTSMYHHALPEARTRVSMGDLEELQSLGLIDIRYGRSDLDGSFRVTGDGHEAVEAIELQDHALASAGVVPPEGARMGLDWETEVFPVLQAVYELYSPAVSGKGVMQPAINERLGRNGDDPHTDLALRKLEEAEYIRGVIRVGQREGPLGSEPAPKALELLAGWPTDRGDAALARLIGVLEARIEEATDPVEKGKLQRVLDAVQEVGQGIMVGVLTNVITGGS